MKILLVTHNFPRHADDMAGAFLLALARGQQALGHELRVLAPHGPGLAEREVVGGVDVVRYRYGPDAEETLAYAGTMHEQALRSWRARWRLLQFVRASRRALARECAAFQPDILHVNWWVPGGFAFWPGNAGGRPVVLTSHGTDLFLLDRFPAARRLAGPIFRAATEVTVISSPLVERVRRLGVPAGHITVLPMPLSADRFEHGPDAGREEGRLLFVGRLIERKGAEFAIRALAELRRRGRGARLTVVGDGPDRPRLEALIKELGLLGVVDLTGTLSHDAVSAHYRSAAVLLMPAVTDWKGEQEGFGMVLVEAMASGLPVVATRSGGIPDVVTDGATGLLVPERDASALAAAAARLLDDPTLAARLAGAARADLDARFAPGAIAHGFDSVYRRAVEAA
ncbi:MAG TPA: glycosyltransferase [Gemmatimonadales bacterium]|nr:glycosyltransferase [Gemmatimonadales bacterium]